MLLALACSRETEKQPPVMAPPSPPVSYEANGVSLQLPAGWEIDKKDATTGEVLALVCNKETGTPRIKGTLTIRPVPEMNIADRLAQRLADVEEESANYQFTLKRKGTSKSGGIDHYYLTYAKTIGDKRRYIREQAFCRNGLLHELQLFGDARDFSALTDDIQAVFQSFTHSLH